MFVAQVPDVGLDVADAGQSGVLSLALTLELLVYGTYDDLLHWFSAVSERYNEGRRSGEGPIGAVQGQRESDR